MHTQWTLTSYGYRCWRRHSPSEWNDLFLDTHHASSTHPLSSLATLSMRPFHVRGWCSGTMAAMHRWRVDTSTKRSRILPATQLKSSSSPNTPKAIPGTLLSIHPSINALVVFTQYLCCRDVFWDSLRQWKRNGYLIGAEVLSKESTDPSIHVSPPSHIHIPIHSTFKVVWG